MTTVDQSTMFLTQLGVRAVYCFVSMQGQSRRHHRSVAPPGGPFSLASKRGSTSNSYLNFSCIRIQISLCQPGDDLREIRLAHQRVARGTHGFHKDMRPLIIS